MYTYESVVKRLRLDHCALIPLKFSERLLNLQTRDWANHNSENDIDISTEHITSDTVKAWNSDLRPSLFFSAPNPVWYVREKGSLKEKIRSKQW